MGSGQEQALSGPSAVTPGTPGRRFALANSGEERSATGSAILDSWDADHPHETPAQNAEELARLAAEADHPGERVWFLEWARAFRKLASLNDHQPPPR
jgi:hypothetical protein